MILYTPLAFEDVFPTPEEKIVTLERWIHGRLCLLRRDADGTLRLERVLSTEPSDYLDPTLQPHQEVGLGGLMEF